MPASPDITDIPAISETRRSTRRKNQNPEDTPSPSPTSNVGATSTGGGNVTESKRGRGRGRGRGGANVGRKSQESSSSNQDLETSPSVPASAEPGSIESTPVQTQPKRRGRKPKNAKENVEVAQTPESEDQLPFSTSNQDASVPLSDDLINSNTDSKVFIVGTDIHKDLETANTSVEPMDIDASAPTNSSLSSSSSFFSSVLKSEPIFGLGGGGGGGIPGLDLDDCEANSATFSSEPVLPPTAPHINLSFMTKTNLLGLDEDDCKSFQQLQITKSEPPESIKTASITASSMGTGSVQRPSIKNEESSSNSNSAPTGNLEDDSSKVRRSSRIKTLEEQRGSRGRRREVVSSLSETSSLGRSSLSFQEDDSNSNSSLSMQASSGYASPSRDSVISGMSTSFSAPNLSSLSSSGFQTNDGGKPFKVKQRWRNSLDTESGKPFPSSGEVVPSGSSGDLISITSMIESTIPPEKLVKRRGHLAFDGTDEELLEKLRKFEGIDETIYRTERKISKENKGMVCDCYLSREEIAQGEIGCTEDCLNRLLMVECGNKCPTGAFCSNKRFQRKEYAPLEVFKTEKKGHGLRTLKAIPEGGFVIEYVGEVLDVPQFERRTTEYAKGNQKHFYFMALKSDAIIDATLRGNCSRFINHSCEPNCETQKWTVNGEVRIGFFAITDLQPGDEITFDYQFQRYGKKAQRCFCMTESCRGWIGEEDDEMDQVEDKEVEPAHEHEEVEENKVKPKPKVERKKRKNVQLEDMAFRDELLKLEQSGLKNRNHTLTLSRLMVRAESWDDRERLLKILINGDTPCRRLFLDYHGLRLIWSWMVDLPLPHESDEPQLIRNDVYHMLFLRALQSLPIPNKSMLMESKVLALVEKWCTVPSVTSTITLVKRTAPEPVPQEPQPDLKEEGSQLQPEKMDTSEVKEEPTSTAEAMQEIVEERVWEFVPLSKTLLDSWADLKEVFRIPKKERVEQMKEHEREADKGQSQSSSRSSGLSSYSYDNRDRDQSSRSKYGTNRPRGGERRVPVLDSTQPQFHRERPQHLHHNRMIVPPGVTKEQWRKHFEETMKAKEQQEVMRKQQDALVTLHQERCALVGLDPATTPIVDPHGVYYLDPKTVEWKQINQEDPTMPPELMKFVQLSQYPPPVSAEVPMEAQVEESVEPEFPPWPQGLPPPPPLPPRELPKNWKMAVDDEGRCYYYHEKTRATQWHPPTENDVSSTESSETSSEEEEIDENVAEGSPVIQKSTVLTWRNKLIERAARRKKTGLVQERIISPRGDDDKGFSKEMVKENKKKALEEKLMRLKLKESGSENEPDPDEAPASGADPSMKVDAGTTPPKPKPSHRMKPSSPMKKRRKEKGHPGSSSSSSKVPFAKSKPKAIPRPSTSASEENLESSSPIETELDLTLSQLDEESDGFFSRMAASAGPSRIIGSTPSMDVVAIPGLGFDTRDLDAKKKADRAARHAAKKKHLAMKKKAKEREAKAHVDSGGAAGGAGIPIASASGSVDKRVSSKEANSIKDAFRNSIATIVVALLNPYRKSDHIKNTDDFKHLARKITHAILLKELKHTRDVASLEVTDSVKHKTKEYIRKFMARFPSGVYIRSPENPQTK